MSGRKDPSPTARFFGGLLMAVGCLIVVTAGTCSLFLGWGQLASVWNRPDQLSATLTTGVPLVLGFGGIPLLVGIALFLIGRSLYRGPSARLPGIGPGANGG